MAAEDKSILKRIKDGFLTAFRLLFFVAWEVGPNLVF